MLTRREAVIAGGAAVLLPATTRPDATSRFLTGLRALEAGIGGDARIGLSLIDTVGVLL